MEGIKQTPAQIYIEKLAQNEIKAEEDKNSIRILTKYDTILIRLSKQQLALKNYELTQEEIYAFKVLYSIELQEIYYAADVNANENMKRFPQLDTQYTIIKINLESEAERLVEMVYGMYYKSNWPVLKPMLEKIISTTKKDSIIYNAIYNKLDENIKIETI